MQTNKQKINVKPYLVSQGTKEPFEKRTREYNKGKPTKERRKRWNKKIRNACRNDYRKWVSGWVERIEQADNKGDTKAIYQGVKALGGQGKKSATRPTMKKNEKEPGPVRIEGVEFPARGS